MKKYNRMIRINMAGTICLLALLAGCKPQEFSVPEADQYAKVFMQSATQSPVSINFEMEDNWFNIPVGAGYGGVKLPDADIEVKFKTDPSLVAEFNAVNGTSYPVMPPGSYELPETTVRVSKGTPSSNSVSLRVNPTKFSGIVAYLLPVSIESINGPASINTSLKTTYYLVKGTYAVNPYQRLSRASWKIAGFSTDENENASGGRAIHAIDGLTTTFWATEWRAAKPRPPHYIIIDMGKTEQLHGLYLAGRVDAAGVPRNQGNPKELTIETSMDGTNWSYSQSYSSVPNIAENELWLSLTQTARYFKVTVNQTHNDFYQTHLTEINAF